MKFTVNLTHAPVGATDFWEYESRDLALAHITALLVADPKLRVTETSKTKFSPEARVVETTFTLKTVITPLDEIHDVPDFIVQELDERRRQRDEAYESMQIAQRNLGDVQLKVQRLEKEREALIDKVRIAEAVRADAQADSYEMGVRDGWKKGVLDANDKMYAAVVTGVQLTAPKIVELFNILLEHPPSYDEVVHVVGLGDKLCPACQKDLDPRGPFACFDCRELQRKGS